MTVYVVAISRKEAQELAKDGMVFMSEKAAQLSLKRDSQVPLRALWAKEAKVWPVSVEG